MSELYEKLKRWKSLRKVEYFNYHNNENISIIISFVPHWSVYKVLED